MFEAIANAWRHHPFFFIGYAVLGLYMVTQLAGMLQGMWARSKSAADRRIVVTLGVILCTAFVFLWRFLYLSIFA